MLWMSHTLYSGSKRLHMAAQIPRVTAWYQPMALPLWVCHHIFNFPSIFIIRVPGCTYLKTMGQQWLWILMNWSCDQSPQPWGLGVSWGFSLCSILYSCSDIIWLLTYYWHLTFDFWHGFIYRLSYGFTLAVAIRILAGTDCSLETLWTSVSRLSVGRKKGVVPFQRLTTEWSPREAARNGLAKWGGHESNRGRLRAFPSGTKQRQG